MYPVSAGEVLELAKQQEMKLLLHGTGDDRFGRTEVRWERVVLQNSAARTR